MPFRLICTDVPSLKIRRCLVAFFIEFFLKRLRLEKNWWKFISNGILYTITYNITSPIIPQITDTKTFGDWMHQFLIFSDEDFKTEIKWTFFITTTPDGTLQLPNGMSREELFYNSLISCFVCHYPTDTPTYEFFLEHDSDECLVINSVVDEKSTDPLYVLKFMTVGECSELLRRL